VQGGDDAARNHDGFKTQLLRSPDKTVLNENQYIAVYVYWIKISTLFVTDFIASIRKCSMEITTCWKENSFRSFYHRLLLVINKVCLSLRTMLFG
jgi:hypothetical protein